MGGFLSFCFVLFFWGGFGLFVSLLLFYIHFIHLIYSFLKCRINALEEITTLQKILSISYIKSSIFILPVEVPVFQSITTTAMNRHFQAMLT